MQLGNAVPDYEELLQDGWVSCGREKSDLLVSLLLQLREQEGEYTNVAALEEVHEDSMV